MAFQNFFSPFERVQGDLSKKSEITRYERIIKSCEILYELRESNPMSDAIITDIDGRKIKIGDKWLIDYASCNYLGFDLDREIMDSIDPAVRKWGTYPSWSRLLGSPSLYEDIEQKIIELIGTEDCLLLPSVTLIHFSIIPILAAEGDIFVDKRAHKTIYDGAVFATSVGATVKKFNHNDIDQLELLLKMSSAKSKLICIDGVYSMSGNYPDIPKFAKLAREHDATLYVDDAHGFGVIGERSPNELCPYGTRGNSIVKYYNETYDNIIMVASLSKSYSSLIGFISCSTKLKNFLKSTAAPYLYSGSAPIATLATLLKSFEVNEKRGEKIRADLYRRTKKFMDFIRSENIKTCNTTDFPIIELPLVNAEDVPRLGQYLFEKGIYVTLSPYPLVPKEEAGFRIQITAANTDEEIDYLIKVIKDLKNSIELQKQEPVKNEIKSQF